MNTPTLAEQVGFEASDAREISRAAFAFVEAGDLDAAIVVFRGLLALNERDAAARAALGSVLEQAGRVEEAEAEYDQALALDPKIVLALVNRGTLRLRRGDEGGRRDLEQAAEEKSPLQQRARWLLGQVRSAKA